MLNEDVTTKNFTIAFDTDAQNKIEFNDHNILIGDSATVDSASLNVAYTDNINAVTFGNITNTAAVAFSSSRIASVNLKGALVGDAALSFSEDEIGDLTLADKEGFKGNLTVSQSYITNLYVNESGLTVDLTDANTITNVYANGLNGAVDFGTSEVSKYVAGYTDAKSVQTFEYEGGVNADELI